MSEIYNNAPPLRGSRRARSASDAASRGGHAPSTRDRARELRANQTDAERNLWHRLRQQQLGVKFRRQQPMGPYIADFFCAQCNLIVELDGGQHGERQEYDNARDAYLRRTGNTVLRFWNHEVMSNMEDVLEEILRHIGSSLSSASPPHPGPPPQGGREIKEALHG